MDPERRSVSSEQTTILGGTIDATIESFLKQTHADKEIDGASKEATLKIVEPFSSSDIRVIFRPDKGVYDAMKKGLHLPRCDAIGFLNSQDTFKEDGAW